MLIDLRRLVDHGFVGAGDAVVEVFVLVAERVEHVADGALFGLEDLLSMRQLHLFNLILFLHNQPLLFFFHL